MFKHLRWKFLTVCLFFIAIIFSIFNFVSAGTSDNVFGWAWSSSFGWVSVNCTATYSCGTINYGVNVDKTTGYFEGYAWSENVGWISFQENDAVPSTFNTGCVNQPSTCTSANSCTACYNHTYGKVHGWAKILSLGDGGWLRMDHGQNNEVSVGSLDGLFSGYGWNGNPDGTGLGWLSFSCENEGVCAASDYKVFGDFVNNTPEVKNMTAPNRSVAEACRNETYYGTQSPLLATLRWDFYDLDAGSFESAYRIVIDDDASMDDPLIDTGKCTASSVGTGDCYINPGVRLYPAYRALGLGNNDYGKTYYWWIKVWDERDLESEWTQYDTLADTDNDDGNQYAFTLYPHRLPNVGFDWQPKPIAIGENVTFLDQATQFVSDSNGFACVSGGGASECDWSWTFEQGLPATSSEQNPTIRFLQGGRMNVSLTVTDNDGYSCTNSVNVENVSVCLPLWQESN